MIAYFLVSVFAGTLGVLQNTINRRIATDWGLPLTLVVNSVVLLVVSIAVLFALRIPAESSVPEFFRARTTMGGFSWYHLVPGIMGYLIICLVPFCVARMGATRVFIAIIAAQIIVSLFWDKWYEGISASPQRILGAVLAFLGAILTLG